MNGKFEIFPYNTCLRFELRDGAMEICDNWGDNAFVFYYLDVNGEGVLLPLEFDGLIDYDKGRVYHSYEEAVADEHS